MKTQYWLNPFTEREWDEFQQAGGNVSGFRDNKWRRVQQIEKRDILICYMVSPILRFFGLLEVTGEPFQDNTPIYGYDGYSSRVPVQVMLSLPPEQGLHIETLKDKISWIRDNPRAWGSYVNWAPRHAEKEEDAKIIISALREVEPNPTEPKSDTLKPSRKTSIFSDRIRPYIPNK